MEVISKTNYLFFKCVWKKVENSAKVREKSGKSWGKICRYPRYHFQCDPFEKVWISLDKNRFVSDIASVTSEGTFRERCKWRVFVCRQSGCSVAVRLIFLLRTYSDTKFCCREWPRLQGTCFQAFSWQQATCWLVLSWQQINSNCCWESTSQQVACCQGSSRQQNFMSEYVLGNNNLKKI